uniref:G-protein coupled receptors family 1 profile domain-containing protein n=1 Tax=Meloidogyne incognita TaxID=6306 RepID=A0A914NQZ8_MELIC
MYSPTTVYTVLYVFWPFSRPLCKIAGSLQGFNIFLSTFSITAIALDRYVLVIFPTKRQRQQNLSLIFFSLIWLASILLAAPLFLAADISPIFHDSQCGIELNLCNEQNERWKELLISKEAYTVGVIILQYLLPLASIAFAYSRIARRMGTSKSFRCASGGRDSRKNSVFLNTPVFGSNRSSFSRQIASGGATSPFIASDNGHKHSSNKQPLVISTNGEYSQTNGNLHNVNPSAEILLKQRRKSIADRHRRTNMLLVTLVVVFACAWLPLNIFHAYTLLFNKFSKTASFSVPIFAICHLTAMCSACLNPCCYAFFNNNFRQEFLAMYRKLGLITLYRCFARFTKRLCPSTEINKEKSVDATQSNENKELGTSPSENEANQHLQQTIQGVLKNSKEKSCEVLNVKMENQTKNPLELCETLIEKPPNLAKTIQMDL